MSGPKVSIVLPTYNGAKYLRKSIESCLNQTYRNIELIIVNDCSTDDTSTIISSYQDDRIIGICHPHNKGLSNSLNTGFASAGGELLTWTSDDNYYDTRAIETMVRFLSAHPSVDFVYSSYYIIDENGAVVSCSKARPVTHLFKYNCVGSCFLYRKKVYEAVGGYDQSYNLIEDYAYWFAVRARFAMRHITVPLYYYRVHSHSLSAQKKHIFDHDVVKSKRYDEMKERLMLQFALPHEKHYLLAEQHYRVRDFRSARRCALLSLKANIRNSYAWELFFRAWAKLMLGQQQK